MESALPDSAESQVTDDQFSSISNLKYSNILKISIKDRIIYNMVNYFSHVNSIATPSI